MPRFLRPERVARIVFVLMTVMALTSLPYWSVAWNAPGIDFYQFWGLAKCQRSSGFRLGSPYLHRRAYQRCLESGAMASGDEDLQAVVAARPEPDTTGTPLSYYVMGLLPGHYSNALLLWHWVQWLAFVAAMLFLVWPFLAPVTAAVLAVATAFAFDPLLLDIQVGNQSTVELLGLVVCAEVLRRGGDRRVRALLLPPVLVLLTLFKPTVGLAAALLGLAVLGRLPVRFRTAAIGAAAFAFACFVLLPAMFFGADVWTDWWTEISASGSRLSYEISTGNYSAVTWVATLAESSAGRAMLGIVLTMGVSKLVAFRFSAGLALRAARAMICDPFAAASAGVIALFALSPLVWSHYQVLAAIPALWLCGSDSERSVVPAGLGWMGLLLMADLPRRLSMIVPLPLSVTEALHAFSWLPLWIGFLLVLRARATADQPVVAIAPFMTPS